MSLRVVSGVQTLATLVKTSFPQGEDWILLAVSEVDFLGVRCGVCAGLSEVFLTWTVATHSTTSLNRF